jgi:hypothetical protein
LYKFLFSVLLAAVKGNWSTSRAYRFTPKEVVPCTLYMGDWVGPRADLDFAEKRKNLSLFQQIELQLPARIVSSLVGIPTELSRLTIWLGVLKYLTKNLNQ